MPLRVLVVDDDPASRMALAAAISSFGHECRIAADGVEAWALHQASHADVILSDWDMPNLDGLSLCRRTRAGERDEASYTYFILMTAFGDREHYVRGMEAGADDYQAKPIGLDELHARLVSAERVVSVYRRLAEKNQRLRRDSQASFTLARVDALTQVGNRLRLDEDLRALWAQSRRYDHTYCAAMCDIDWFKTYNDHYGHLKGDDLLRTIADTIRSELRAGDTVYRYGGEEFVVILPEQTLSDAVQAAERIRSAIERLALPTSTKRGVVTISIGVAALETTDPNATSWLARADTALYQAKEAGRNRVVPAPRVTEQELPSGVSSYT